MKTKDIREEGDFESFKNNFLHDVKIIYTKKDFKKYLMDVILDWRTDKHNFVWRELYKTETDADYISAVRSAVEEVYPQYIKMFETILLLQ